MTLDDYRRQARARFGSATPFRVGYVAGLAADWTIQWPPRWTQHMVQLFEAGRAAGMEQRVREETR